jgi:glycosyltransferase involved in cell wall biosynthesis
LQVPVKTFLDYEALSSDLASREAIKVATWWETSDCVWRASLGSGVPVYLVQDIEAAYYGDEHPQVKARVLASYRKEFHYVADATWTRQQLRSLGVEAQVVSPGVDPAVFRPLERERRDDVVLSIGRASPLKNLELTLRGVAPLGDRATLWLFGIEPDVGKDVAARYAFAPTDAEVADLYNQATVFVSTSDHEGFGLPMLEAMACGCPVICTDADGNMDFCRDGENCLIVPKHRPEVLTAAVERLLRDRDLQRHLRRGGLETARAFTWQSAISKLEAFYGRIAGERSGRLRAPERALAEPP